MNEFFLSSLKSQECDKKLYEVNSSCACEIIARIKLIISYLKSLWQKNNGVVNYMDSRDVTSLFVGKLLRFWSF